MQLGLFSFWELVNPQICLKVDFEFEFVVYFYDFKVISEG